MKKAKKKCKENKGPALKKKPVRPSYADVLRTIENVPTEKPFVDIMPQKKKKKNDIREGNRTSKHGSTSLSTSNANPETDFPPLESLRNPISEILASKKLSTMTDRRGNGATPPKPMNPNVPRIRNFKARATTLGQLFLHNHMSMPRSPLYILFPPPRRKFLTRRASSRHAPTNSLRPKFGLIGVKNTT